MANIDVVPKHRSNAWLWIVVAIIAIALGIWAITGRSQAPAPVGQLQPGTASHQVLVQAGQPILRA
jgi:hypothetical protein